MKIFKLFAATSVAFFIAGSALAQNAGTVTNHAYAIGKGAGTTGFTSLLCLSAQLAVGQTAADPICRTLTGDVTIDAAGVTAIGAIKVTSAMLNADVFSTAHTWSGQQTFVAPVLGTPASGTLTNATGLPISTGLSGAGTGVLTALGINVGSAGAFVVNGGALGTPSSGTATNITGLPVATGISGLGTGVATALAVNVGSAGSPVVNGGALGTPSSGTLTNATGLPLTGLTNQAAFTVVANATGSSAPPTAVSIPALTEKASPVAADKIMIADSAASDALKYATVSSIATAGSVASINGQTGALILGVTPQVRITLTSGVAVMASTVTAANTVLVTPAVGNQIPIYDGTNMVPTSFAEVSQLTTDTTKSPAAATTNSNYDVFCWVDSGTNRCTRGPPWTSNTVRGTGAGTTELVTVAGILLNANSITNGPAAQRGTYIGTIRTNGTSTVDYIFGGAASGGTAGRLCVWNMYNRNLTTSSVVDTGTNYTYTSSTLRQARASAGNQTGVLVGLAVDTLFVSYLSRIDTAAVSGAFGSIGIGEDSTTVNHSQRVFTRTTAAVVMIGTPYISISKTPLIGFHTYAALEASDGSNASTFDADSTGTLNLTIYN